MIAEYLKEMQGYEVYEKPAQGFMLYRVVGDEFHVGHFYTAKSCRNTGVGLQIGKDVEALARDKGCAYLSCIVRLDEGKPEMATQNMYYYLKFGFEIAQISGNSIILKKSL